MGSGADPELVETGPSGSHFFPLELYRKGNLKGVFWNKWRLNFERGREGGQGNGWDVL